MTSPRLASASLSLSEKGRTLWFLLVPAGPGRPGGCLKVPGVALAIRRRRTATPLLPPQALERMRLKMEIAAEDVDELPRPGPGHQ